MARQDWDRQCSAGCGMAWQARTDRNPTYGKAVDVQEASPPTGDVLTNALVPVASALIGAVHAMDPEAVAAALADAEELAGGQLAAAQALTVLLAAWCSEDHAPAAALGWTNNPTAYHQYRSTADALTASLRAGRTALAQPEGTDA
jgi:hypothetical protein